MRLVLQCWKSVALWCSWKGKAQIYRKKSKLTQGLLYFYFSIFFLQPALRTKTQSCLCSIFGRKNFGQPRPDKFRSCLPVWIVFDELICWKTFFVCGKGRHLGRECRTALDLWLFSLPTCCLGRNYDSTDSTVHTSLVSKTPSADISAFSTFPLISAQRAGIAFTLSSLVLKWLVHLLASFHCRLHTRSSCSGIR